MKSRIAVVTGSRAEYGLLRPVMHAIADHGDLELLVVVTGAHLLPPARTIDEIASEFPLAGTIPMQREGAASRLDEAAALGRGVTGCAQWLAEHPVEVVVVLGDRVEAFAAACAAAVGGVRVAHLHGGDRAEGLVDESLRHAITKLAHIHLPASEEAARRIVAMGEDPQCVHVVGSPAIDGLEDVPPLPERAWSVLGRPGIVFLMHPVGGDDEQERAWASVVLEACHGAAPGRVLAMHPNHDPGRGGIVAAIEASGVRHAAHLPRREWIGLLNRVEVLVGNSSAGIIEAAALGVPVVNVGPRQAGRERPGNVVDVPESDAAPIAGAIERARRSGRRATEHPFGDGSAGRQAAAVLAGFDRARHPIRKRNAY